MVNLVKIDYIFVTGKMILSIFTLELSNYMKEKVFLFKWLIVYSVN